MKTMMMMTENNDNAPVKVAATTLLKREKKCRSHKNERTCQSEKAIVDKRKID
jgi:hypothetical protein